MKNKKYLITISITIITFIFTGGIIQAEEYNIEEIIKQGLNNNLEIKQIENDIKTIKRDIQLVKSSSDWQADLNLNKVIVKEDTIQIFRDKNRLDISLNKKAIEDKMNLNPTITYDFDGSEVVYGVNINMNVYPALPSENSKKLINLNNKLKQKNKQLSTKKAELVKEWVDNYIQLVRLKKNIDVLKDRYEIAENEYHEIQEKVQIGETGQQELLQAKFDLKDAEYNLKEEKQLYLRLKTVLLTDIQLDKNTDILLDVENRLLTRLKNESANIDVDKIDKTQLINNIVKTSSQFTAVINQNNYLKKEFYWLKKEDSPKISVEGGYDSKNDLSVNLNISYNLFDSGINKLQLENKKQEIKNKKLDLKQLYQETEVKLENILDQIELAKMEIKRDQLQHNKVVDEIDIIARQYESGAIEEKVLINKKLNKRTTRLNLKRAEDKLLLNKLALLILTEPNDIVDAVNIDNK